MSHIEKTAALLRSIPWSDKPAPVTDKSLADAELYLRAFAKFVLECRADPSREPTLLASPCGVLSMKEAPLASALLAECAALAAQSRNAYDAVYARHALEWAALCDSDCPATRGREDLFEPLLRLVGSRVPALIRKGYWVVGENMFPMADWLTRYGKTTEAGGRS